MNNIQIAELFTNLVDEKYRADATTAIFESNLAEIGIGKDYGKYHIMKVDTDGIGTYDRNEGYADGAAYLEWETVIPDIDLSAGVIMDYYENEEALAKAFPLAADDIMNKMIDQVDATRYAKISAIAKNKVEEKIETGEDAVKSLRKAINYMKNKRTYNDKILIAKPEIYGALEDMDSYKSQIVTGNFIKKIEVPEHIFYTAIETFTGRGENKKFGYKKADNARDINYMIVSKSSIIAKTNNRVKWIDAEQNQNLDAHIFRIRTSGLSAYGLDNKVDGIYVSYAPAAVNVDTNKGTEEAGENQ